MDALDLNPQIEDSQLDNSADLGNSEIAEESTDEPTFEIDGEQLTAAQIKEAMSLAKDYTSKRQQESEQLKTLEAEIQAIKEGQMGPPVDFDPVEWFQKETGVELSDEGQHIITMLDNITRKFGEELAKLNPIVETHQSTAAEAGFISSLSAKGLNIPKEKASAALQAAKGDRAEALMILMAQGTTKPAAPTPPPGREKPATPNVGVKPGSEVDVTKLSEAEYEAWMKASLQSHP